MWKYVTTHEKELDLRNICSTFESNEIKSSVLFSEPPNSGMLWKYLVKLIQKYLRDLINISFVTYHFWSFHRFFSIKWRWSCQIWDGGDDVLHPWGLLFLFRNRIFIPHLLFCSLINNKKTIHKQGNLLMGIVNRLGAAWSVDYFWNT